VVVHDDGRVIDVDGGLANRETDTRLGASPANSCATEWHIKAGFWRAGAGAWISDGLCACCMRKSTVPRPERQTARVALLIKPSMKSIVERRARFEGVTANEFIRCAVEHALAVEN
jgi:hypothetical protein